MTSCLCQTLYGPTVVEICVVEASLNAIVASVVNRANRARGRRLQRAGDGTPDSTLDNDRSRVNRSKSGFKIEGRENDGTETREKEWAERHRLGIGLHRSYHRLSRFNDLAASKKTVRTLSASLQHPAIIRTLIHFRDAAIEWRRTRAGSGGQRPTSNILQSRTASLIAAGHALYLFHSVYVVCNRDVIYI